MFLQLVSCLLQPIFYKFHWSLQLNLKHHEAVLQPGHAELVIKTVAADAEAHAQKIVAWLRANGYLG